MTRVTIAFLKFYLRKCNGEECDSNEFLSLDSNISGKSTSSDNSASGKKLFI